MVQTRETADAVIAMDQQVAFLEVVESVQALDGPGRGARCFFRAGIDDVLAQNQTVVPDQFHAGTEG